MDPFIESVGTPEGQHTRLLCHPAPKSVDHDAAIRADERAKIVKWLRVNTWTDAGPWARRFADDIEAGKDKP
jgi:hypothetical protein